MPPSKVQAGLGQWLGAGGAPGAQELVVRSDEAGGVLGRLSLGAEPSLALAKGS